MNVQWCGNKWFMWEEVNNVKQLCETICMVYRKPKVKWQQMVCVEIKESCEKSHVENINTYYIWKGLHVKNVWNVASVYITRLTFTCESRDFSLVSMPSLSQGWAEGVSECFSKVMWVKLYLDFSILCFKSFLIAEQIDGESLIWFPIVYLMSLSMRKIPMTFLIRLNIYQWERSIISVLGCQSLVSFEQLFRELKIQ